MTVRSRSGRKWTYEDYAAIPPDLLRHEIIDGEHFVNPAPSVYHQRISGRLYVQLFLLITESGLGEVFDAPIDVQLSGHDVIQPDLVVVLEASRAIINASKIVGAPDLVVEILSPGTRDNDRTLKKQRYCRAGVPEYWIVDPDAHAVEQYRWQAEAYELIGTETESVCWTRLPDVTIDLTRVW